MTNLEEPATGVSVPTKILLPIFPNGKGHVSYSEILDWVECSYRHKLKHVQKIDLDGGSIHTAFGTAVHFAGETYLSTRVLPTVEEILEVFKAELKLLPEEAQAKAIPMLSEFVNNLGDMVGQIPNWVNTSFPGWELVEAEKKLYEDIAAQDGLKFKGFIDGVIRVKKEPTKKLLLEHKKAGTVCPDLWKYVILDWKTCSFGWKAETKRSFVKQLQLILYKYYFSQNSGIPLDQIQCAWVLIKRTRPSNGKRIELVVVPVGPVAIDKALKVVHNMVNQVRKGFAMKNRRYCKPFCPYNNTKFCT